MDVGDAPLEQLVQVKNQIAEEREYLLSSLKQLKAAESKLVASKGAVRDLPGDGTESLVPLTDSLYVPARLRDTETFLVDVGTGYYVRMSREATQAHIERKIALLKESANMCTSKINENTQKVEALGLVIQQKAAARAGMAAQ